MKCLNSKCLNDHNGSFGSGKYCSKACSNSRIWTEKDKEKKSKSAQGSKKIKEAAAKRTYKVNALKAKATWNKKLLEVDFNSLSYQRLARRVKLEQNNKCSRCSLDKWLGKQLTLELEHKDGNRKNNKRENLEALCPNCHSLTNTWRGRNCRKNPTKTTDEQILQELVKTKNIHQCLLNLGLAPKGGNYKRVYKIIEMSNLKL